MTPQRWPVWLPLREDLRDLTAYGAPQIESVVRLNTNENPYPLSAELVKAITERVAEIASSLNRYPDRDAVELRRSLANFLNELSATELIEENIWAANGSNEIIQSIFLAFGGGSALGFTPSYSMHPLIARVTQTPWINGLRSDDFTIDVDVAKGQMRSENAKLVFVTTPNNPTGTSVPIHDIEKLAQAASEIGALLIVDEAYAEFSAQPSAVTLLNQFPNLVVIRTMSKAFAFAGVRLGYMAADPIVIEAMKLVRLPYHLSALTQAAGLAALEHRATSLRTVATLRRDRDLVAAELSNFGARVIPSSANFLLFSVSNSQRVWTTLLEKGVLIRDVGLSGYLRVTIGTPSENQKFLEALRSSIGGSE
jgi:histidinol-phosphate aminotransferase